MVITRWTLLVIWRRLDINLSILFDQPVDEILNLIVEHSSAEELRDVLKLIRVDVANISGEVDIGAATGGEFAYLKILNCVNRWIDEQKNIDGIVMKYMFSKLLKSRKYLEKIVAILRLSQTTIVVEDRIIFSEKFFVQSILDLIYFPAVTINSSNPWFSRFLSILPCCHGEI
jgi:hypothetical protein